VICSSVVLADVIDAVSPSTVTVLLDAVALKPEPVIVAAAPSVQVAVIVSTVGPTLLTVISAVALTDPDVAVTVAEPSATAVTSPVVETVATDAVDVVHETVTPDITFPPASFTVAVSVAVSASEAKLTVVGESVSDVAT
jgi:hypothetical protein